MGYPSLKPVWKQQSNKEYETNNSAYGPVMICDRKVGQNSARRICEMMPSNAIHYNNATSTFVSSLPRFEMFSCAKHALPC
jgi:hypothetical protein